MKEFLLKVNVIVSIFFLGILIGIFQDKHEEEPPTEGKTDKAIFSLFQAEQTEVDLRVKKAEMTEQDGVNIFSEAGQTVADSVTFIVSSLFQEER
ncbi:hypothetical protein [Bacillus thermotolerans]|uniref:Uncharacterized protein n=1 Tax=Bacillus thermotolerans TaxID=1221996 RepID=A0A0F5ICX9_BACTR|nr:hypothetical protein [Bacillus thermotolerans]KKB43185.1 hypothetical protein QY95_02171 [Bacillus thermotolerans]KKB43588.1 hypothetical protein QY96_00825 [Bacillus thermotolerans]